MLLQTRRFVSSGNRVGATFSVGTNYLSDWLNKERHQLLGALPDAGGSEQFPYARQQLYAMERKLPAEFDWRERGAVTPVRCMYYQSEPNEKGVIKLATILKLIFFLCFSSRRVLIVLGVRGDGRGGGRAVPPNQAPGAAQ